MPSQTNGATVEPFDLTAYDLIVVNSSAGKDSQAMLDVVAGLAADQGVTDRVVVLHCDLGEVEWDGTVELAQEQAEAYGLPFTTEAHAKGLLERVRERRMWPGPTTRFCTSELKTGMARRATTRLLVERGLDKKTTGRQAKVLHTLGLRAAESPARAKKATFQA
jgi:3'-phosphoadenosine 5'-phosphosulfate sulfotransferase (PAPS reductase)/FAD synthetase